MRILHALSQTELTGSESYAFDLVNHQVGQGHFVITVSDKLHLNFPGEKIAILLSTNSFFARMQNIRRLRRLLIEKQIDVIHCHSRGACRHLHWARMGLEIPILTTIHGYQHSSLSKRLFNIYGDYILAVCEKIRDQMISDLRTKVYAIEVLRNPIYQKDKVFALPTTPKGQPRRVLLAGRNSGPKGQRLKTIFKDWATQQKNWPKDAQVHLVLSGLPGPEREKLQALWPAALVEGHLPSLDHAVAHAEIVLGSGRIALEALAAGKRVFALGESSQPGLINERTEEACLFTNFGDVGPLLALDLPTISQAVRGELAKSTLIEQQKIAPRILQNFESAQIFDRILNLYRGLRLFTRAPFIPILMYHKVVGTAPETPHRTFILESAFRKHLQFFKSRKFTSMHFADLADFWWERRPVAEFPAKPLIITFDDGYRNNLEKAAPHLQKAELKAEIFLLADAGIQRNTWDPDEGDESSALMTFDEKRQLPRPTYAIGSHGLSHRAFPQLTEVEILTELRGSKIKLEADFGTSVSAFAYPFGAIDGRLPELAKRAGYDFAVNTDQGPVYWFTQPHSLFRVNIFPEDGVWSLWKKTSRWYRQYYFRRRGR